MEFRYIICPCCGVKLKITDQGAVECSAFSDDKPNERIAEALKACGYEFGVIGGETS